MPIYEYQCDNCQQVTEAWQGLAEEPLTTCQSCAGPLKKLISMSSFHLKGGGWYADGYSSKATSSGSCKSTGCDSKSSASCAAASSTTSDSKSSCAASTNCACS